MSSARAPYTPLDRFLGAVHRRYVCQRLLERIGLGLLGGCGGAVLLLPLLLWQDRPALPAVAVSLGFGAVLGVLWGVTRRPTLLDAAMEADRQLGLKDLLGTAAAFRDRPAEPWSAAVLATAVARCRELKPRAVVLNRLGARAWGGIGLSTAAVLTVTLLAGSASDTPVAAWSRDSAGIMSAGVTTPEPTERPLVLLSPTPPAAALEHDDPDAGRSAGRPADARPPDRGNGPPKASNDASPHTGGSAAPGVGSGSSQTHPPVEPPRPPAVADERSGSEGRHETPGVAVPTGGAGRAGDAHHPAPGSPGGAAGASAAAGQNSHQTLPWRTEAWPTAVQRAHEALNSGQVLPAYQEMVRRYFDQP